MKYISRIDYKVNVENVDFALESLIRYLLDNAETFNKDGKGIRCAVRIEQAMSLALSSSAPFIALEDEDYKRLLEVALNPGVPYPLRPARALMPFIDSIESAKDKLSETEEKLQKATSAS